MAYQPIENHGIIGDMHTIALVAVDGTIDWFCFPHFDSPSVFGSILDDKKGGYFRIAPVSNDAVKRKQFYWPDSNVLITRFFSGDGVGQIADFMPVGLSTEKQGRHQLIRGVRVVRGEMKFRLECHPAFNYARDEHTVEIGSGGASFHTPALSLGLSTKRSLQQNGDGVTLEFTLKEGEQAHFVFGRVERGGNCHVLLDESEALDLAIKTIEYWRHWLAQCTYRGRWREMVHRSALALKLLTFKPTGAIVAAPTAALPEDLGGERNWDYRYTWIRDAAFTLYGLLRIGFTEEAGEFMKWVEARCHELNPDGSLQIMYGLDGRHELTEETLDHLDGYMGSKPRPHRKRRLQSASARHLWRAHGLGLSLQQVRLPHFLRPLGPPPNAHQLGLRQLAKNRRRDLGSPRRSAALRLLQAHVLGGRGSWPPPWPTSARFPADWERWLKVRDDIYEEIMSKGWNEERQAFVQHYGSNTLDAANLMMPLVFYLSPSDPRSLKSLDATMQPPHKGGLLSNSLVYRYNVSETEDGLAGEEGTFNICTFWLVESLTRAGRTDRRRLERARVMFEEMLGYANHLGLYAEPDRP